MPAKIPECVRVKQINMMPNIKFVRWESNYENSHSKAICKCLRDGTEWSATITNLIHGGNECPSCAQNKRNAAISIDGCEVEATIRASKEYKFICFDGVYKNLKTKVSLECVHCGDVWSVIAQQPYRGKTGCPKCSVAKRASKRAISAADRESLLMSIEGLSFVKWHDKYKNKNSRAVLCCGTCKGEWVASVGKVLTQGTRCPVCSVTTRSAKRRLRVCDIESAITSINGVSLVGLVGEYKNNRSKVVVVCDKGHKWSTSCVNLINNERGCPACAKSGYDPSKTGTLYALRSECGSMVKIGISNDHKRRHQELAARTPFEWRCIELVHGEGAKIAELEQELLGKTEPINFGAQFDGYTEWRKWDARIPEWFRAASA